MRCLRALGEWEKLASLAAEVWVTAPSERQHEAAPLAAAAAFHLHRFEQLSQYAAALPVDTVDGAWYRAVVTLHGGDVAAARVQAARARQILDHDITALVGEGYKRAYKAVVTAQLLVELDEVAEYRAGDAVTCARLRRMWNERLDGAQRNVDIWQRILAVRSLVVPPASDPDAWVRFASLCRKAERRHMAVRALSTLLGTTPGAVWDDAMLAAAPPRVAYACIKHMWYESSGLHDAAGAVRAADRLRQFAAGFAQTDSHLASRAFLRLGEWARLKDDTPSEATLSQITADARTASELDSHWWKAWHALALVNYDAVTHYAAAGNTAAVQQHVLPAVRGFINSIALSGAAHLYTLQARTIFIRFL
jgi:FKBP12-rapamycin complex-associated protein